MSPIFLADLWDIGVAFYVGMGQHIGITTYDIYIFARDIVIANVLAVLSGRRWRILAYWKEIT